MKAFSPFLMFLLISMKLYGQDSLWTSTKINENLIMKLPVKFEYSRSAYIEAYGGYLNSFFLGLQFYDTVFNQINTERQFQIALTGFVNGRLADSSLKNYTVSIADSIIGNTKGVMAKLEAIELNEPLKRVYYYFTIANNKFYWFYAYCEDESEENKEATLFFQSINFDKEKIKENSFSLKSIYLTQ